MKLSTPVVIHLSRHIDFLRIFDTIISLVFDGFRITHVSHRRSPLLFKMLLLLRWIYGSQPRWLYLHWRSCFLTFCMFGQPMKCESLPMDHHHEHWWSLGSNNWSMNVNMMIKAFTFLCVFSLLPYFYLNGYVTLHNNVCLFVCLFVTKRCNLFGIQMIHCWHSVCKSAKSLFTPL